MSAMTINKVCGSGLEAVMRAAAAIKAGDPAFVYCGRANRWDRLPKSKWANPFVIGKDGTREEVIAKYRAYITSQPDLMAALPELLDKTLVCWCKPAICHCDILKELAEGTMHE